MESNTQKAPSAAPAVPTVSVIVPNYNHARFLRKRIDTILAQTYQDFELILLDDASTDDSRSILSSYSNDARIGTLQFNEKNTGSTFRQWNEGVRLARGEYIWIAESDDYAEPQLLERLVATLSASSTVVLAYCRSWRAYADDHVDGFVDPSAPDIDPLHWTTDYCVNGRDECRNYFVLLNIIPNSSAVLFRKSIFDEVGGADDSLRLCGDWKLWASMALAGKVAYVADPLNYFRFHETSVREESKRQSLVSAEYLFVVRWLLSQVSLTKEVRTKLRPRLAWGWLPAVSTWDMPLGRRCAILRDAIAIEPLETLRSVVPAGLGAVKRKFLRHWHSIQSARRSA